MWEQTKLIIVTSLKVGFTLQKSSRKRFFFNIVIKWSKPRIFPAAQCAVVRWGNAEGSMLIGQLSTALKSPSGLKITGCGMKDLSLAVYWKIKQCKTNTPIPNTKKVCVCVCVSQQERLVDWLKKIRFSILPVFCDVLHQPLKRNLHINHNLNRIPLKFSL